MFACSDSRPVFLGARPDGQISVCSPSQALEFFDAGLNGVIEFEL
jgi:hypothetical protein